MGIVVKKEGLRIVSPIITIVGKTGRKTMVSPIITIVGVIGVIQVKVQVQTDHVTIEAVVVAALATIVAKVDLVVEHYVSFTLVANRFRSTIGWCHCPWISKCFHFHLSTVEQQQAPPQQQPGLLVEDLKQAVDRLKLAGMV